jgi:glycosyltransferase involved in cell wall biosynthesis
MQTKPKTGRTPQHDIQTTLFSSLDVGGAGIAAARLFGGLQSIGAHAGMLTLERRSARPGITAAWTGAAAGNGESPWLRTWKHWQEVWARFPARPAGLEIFTDTFCLADISRHPLVRGADVANLHWMPGLLDMERAAQTLAGKAVVWTMHDMNPFTGGCHYSAGCRRFEVGCGCCPQLGSTEPEDLSRQIWLIKRQAYAALRPVLAAPSGWLAAEARRSLLGRECDIRVIPNGLPTDTFAPSPRERQRDRLGIPREAFCVLLGHDVLSARKGWPCLERLMEIFPVSAAGRQVVFAIFGTLVEDMPAAIAQRVRFLGRQDDEAALAGAYAMADVYVSAALEDNLPNTILEAMACGTPTAAFATGGVTDLVLEGITGHLATPLDVEGLVRAALAVGEQGDLLRGRCRERALRAYRLERQAERYQTLFAELAASRRGAAPRAAGGAPFAGAATPQISVITPVLNAEASILACMENVSSQACDAVEHLIVDGESTDGTLRIVQEYAASHPHVRWVSRKDTGQSEAMNRGVALARGEVVGFLNADDAYEPGVLRKVCEKFSKLRVGSFLVADVNVHQQDGAVYTNRPAKLELFDLLLERGEHPFNPAAYFYHKGLHLLAGPYDESEDHVMDLDFLLRALPLANKLRVDEVWGNMRYVPGTKTFDDKVDGMARARVEAALAKHAQRQRISFIVPAYNCEDTLAESIASIYNGNFTPGDEVIIVDDASTDATFALASHLALRYPAVRLARHSINKGSAAAGRNTGIDASSNELIFCLDSDNVLVPGSVPGLKSHLLARRADAAAFGELRFFTQGVGQATHSWFMDSDITLRQALLSPAKAPCSSGNYLFTKSSWKRAGRYDESAGGAYDSYVFGLAQLATGAVMVTQPGICYWHRHGHEAAFVRDCGRYNASLLVLRALLNHLDKLDPALAELLFSPRWRTTWFDQLDAFRKEIDKAGAPA